MQIKWTELALDDLAAIQSYISKDSILYAKQFIEQIFNTINHLKDFPEIGRAYQKQGKQKMCGN